MEHQCRRGLQLSLAWRPHCRATWTFIPILSGSPRRRLIVT